MTKFGPILIAAGVAAALGISGTLYMAQADDDDHHTGSMHGQGMAGMGGMMGGMDMPGMGMDQAAMDEMHAGMADFHEANGGQAMHDAMHSMMSQGSRSP